MLPHLVIFLGKMISSRATSLSFGEGGAHISQPVTYWVGLGPTEAKV